MNAHSLTDTEHNKLLRLINEEVIELNLDRTGVSGPSKTHPNAFIQLTTTYKEFLGELHETYTITIQPLEKQLLTSNTKLPHVAKSPRTNFELTPNAFQSNIRFKTEPEYFVTAYTSLHQRSISNQPEHTPGQIIYQPTSKSQKLTRSKNNLSKPIEELTQSLYNKIDRMI